LFILFFHPLYLLSSIREKDNSHRELEKYLSLLALLLLVYSFFFERESRYTIGVLLFLLELEEGAP
jgi:hypothetical protein